MSEQLIAVGGNLDGYVSKRVNWAAISKIAKGRFIPKVDTPLEGYTIKKEIQPDGSLVEIISPIKG
ncbi:hypothetical protein HCA69_12275 [Listeria grandensis]|uniref:Uncharacterized protein n=1 Tax=Listeria grandensis TaxID=1494963 RepID=A0A7X1CQK4_9LIST|nr:hypothetical protein [Listeria grandensis]MBC1937148.1 hypothetical protein [Listeria grandensis]